MKMFILTLFVLFAYTLEAQYRENKKNFNYKDYSYEPGDRYNPTLAGAASFLVPGLGQIIVGETGRGLAFMGGYVASYAVILTATSEFSDDPLRVTSSQQTRAILGLTGILISSIWSIGDAVRVAKVNNLASREINKKVSFSLQPIVLPQTNTKLFAGGLQLNIRLD